MFIIHDNLHFQLSSLWYFSALFLSLHNFRFLIPAHVFDGTLSINFTMVRANPTIDEGIQKVFSEQISKLPKKRGKQLTSAAQLADVAEMCFITDPKKYKRLR